jgi:CHAT domain-containing protein/tetratricopeptide (TPR) repeat protein
LRRPDVKPHTHICLQVALICAYAVSCTAQESAAPAAQEGSDGGEIRIRHDPREHETKIELHMRILRNPAEEWYILLSGPYPAGAPKNPPKAVSLGVSIFSTKGYRFPDVSALTFVADGERLPAAFMLRKNRRMYGAEFAETLVTWVNYEIFERVAFARTVEMRLYDTDFHPDAAQTQKMREFARRVYPLGAGRVAERERILRERGGATSDLGPFEILAETAEDAGVSQRAAQLYRDGRYDEAIQLVESVVARSERSAGAESAQTALALNSLGLLLFKKGDYLGAESKYKRALEILERVRGPNDPNLAVTLDNLGLLYVEMGDLSRAEEQLLRALIIFFKTLGEDNHHTGVTANNLGRIYTHGHEFKDAEAFYLQALKTLEKSDGRESPAVADVLDNLALLYDENGFAEAGWPLAERALEIFYKTYGQEHPEVATALNNLALRYVHGGDPARAEPLLRRALAIREKYFGPSHPEFATVLQNLALTYAELGRMDEALAASSRVQEIRERYLTLMLTTGSEEQRRLYARTLMGETDAAVSLHVQTAPGDRRALKSALAVVLRRKGRVLDAMIEQYGALRRSDDPRDRDLRRQLSDARARLSTLIHRAADIDPAQYRESAASLEAEIGRLEADTGGRGVATDIRTQAVTPERVQESIPADAALVEFVSYVPAFPLRHMPPSQPPEGAHYVAYVLKHEGEPQWVELGRAAPTDAGIARLRGALRNPAGADVSKLARSLDESLMRPVRRLLGDRRRVFISPEGSLNLLPFCALLDERGRYLVEDYTFIYLSSGRDLLRLRAPSPSRGGPLVIADPAFDASPPGGEVQPRADADAQRVPGGEYFSHLTDAAEEARAIGSVLAGAKVLTGDSATESALKQVSGPSILHIATHGFFRSYESQTPLGVAATEGGASPSTASRYDSPLLRSGLALAGANRLRGGGDEDGILTALEASGLDLWGTKLVVLSACETGLGDVLEGEGVYGLRRALALAGAESQVMTLWTVNGDATRDLMVRYYGRLKAGEGRGDALRQVQLELLGTEKRCHPYFWAGFIPQGDWRNLNGEDARPAPERQVKSPCRNVAR